MFIYMCVCTPESKVERVRDKLVQTSSQRRDKSKKPTALLNGVHGQSFASIKKGIWRLGRVFGGRRGGAMNSSSFQQKG